MFTKRLKIDVEKISGPIAVVKFISTRLVVLENVKAGIRGTSCTWYNSLDCADPQSGPIQSKNIVPGDPSYEGESVGPVWGTILSNENFMYHKLWLKS